MTKRDIALLLSPSIFFVVVAVAAFIMSAMIRQHTREDGHAQKFDAFVTNVQSGKWELTPDKWLDGIRREEATAESYRQAGAATGQMFLDLCGAALVGFIFQIAVVFSVRKRLSKP
jgi:hypothetical protein